MYWLVVGEDCNGKQQILGTYFSTDRHRAKKRMEAALLNAPKESRPYKVYLAKERAQICRFPGKKFTGSKARYLVPVKASKKEVVYDSAPP